VTVPGPVGYQPGPETRLLASHLIGMSGSSGNSSGPDPTQSQDGARFEAGASRRYSAAAREQADAREREQ